MQCNIASWQLSNVNAIKQSLEGWVWHNRITEIGFVDKIDFKVLFAEDYFCDVLIVLFPFF